MLYNPLSHTHGRDAEHTEIYVSTARVENYQYVVLSLNHADHYLADCSRLRGRRQSLPCQTLEKYC